VKQLISICALVLVSAGMAAAEPLKGDGPGCKDKALGIELASLQETHARYISIWAQGIQDLSCRGFSGGLEVTVEARDGTVACVRTAEDDVCYWVRADMAP
jgi:hypothetical protein